MTPATAAHIGAKVGDGAVDTSLLTTRDSVDNAGCPPLGAFRPDVNRQRCTNVDGDVVDAVTALSTAIVDTVTADRRGPLSEFEPASSAQTGHPQHQGPHVVDAVTAPTRERTPSTDSIDVVQQTYYYPYEPKPQVAPLSRIAPRTRGPPR